MDEKNRKTVGEISSDLLKKDDHLKDYSSEEMMREQLENWDKNIHEAIEDGKKFYNKDFFIVVETKKERLMSNVLRNYFFHRLTCPTPTYDQVVYHYHKDADHIEFLWVLPSKEVYNMVMNHALELTPDQKELVKYVLDDSDGTLLKKSKILNNEI